MSQQKKNSNESPNKRMYKHLPVTGGSLCGAVRYESSEPPEDGGCCHCDMCRKATGGLFFFWLRFPDGALRITKGEISFFKSSTHAKRGFCPNCGTSLAFAFEGNPTLEFAVGSLDRPDDWPPDEKTWWGHAFVDEKVSWDVISDGMARHTSSERMSEYHDAKDSLGDGNASTP